jgi:hypothetical protein
VITIAIAMADKSNSCNVNINDVEGQGQNENENENENENAANGTNTNTNDGCCCGCCGRFKNEFSTKIFALVEEPYGELDMERNFMIGEGLLSVAGLLKTLFFGLVVATLAVDLLEESYPGFYMAFLTSWSLVYCIPYLLGSLLLTAVPYLHDNDDNTILLKITWMSFSLVAVHQLCVLFLYWITVFVPGESIQFANFMSHGGCMVLCLIDGLIVNRTPVRIGHVILNMAMAVLYAIWSALQNTVIRYNPYGENDDDEDDDSIYDVMKWRTQPGLAVGVFLGLLLVAIPLFQLLFWALSLPGRKYLPATQFATGE